MHGAHPLQSLGEPQQGEVGEGHRVNADSALQLSCEEIQGTLPLKVVLGAES